MIGGYFHKGSGLGNQLHRYVMTRTLATDKDYDFGMVAPENFKGSEFMDLYMGVEIPGGWSEGKEGQIVHNGLLKSFSEKQIRENAVDIRGYDPDINFVEDNTIIDGEFQDYRYFSHRLGDIAKWFKTKQLYMPDEVCVIGFRGGEYQYFPDLFLPKSYYEKAMACIREIRPDVKFICVTDDPDLACKFLPGVKITHDLADDWRMIRSANYLILSNSSFYILPALINNHVKKTIAPRYWARYNTGVWATNQNYYPKFQYI